MKLFMYVVTQSCTSGLEGEYIAGACVLSAINGPDAEAHAMKLFKENYPESKGYYNHIVRNEALNMSQEAFDAARGH